MRWLLELPRPFTRLTWDNAALIAPQTAARLGLETRDAVLIRTEHGEVTAPVFVLPGQAENCVTLPLGFGRRHGGAAAGVGLRRISAARRRRSVVGAGDGVHPDRTDSLRSPKDRVSTGSPGTRT